MPVPATMALSGVQAGIESTRGTLIAATRIAYINGGMLQFPIKREFPDEQRNSFVDNYRSFQVSENVEVSGLTTAPTFEDLPWWFQFFLKGGVSGVQIGVTGAYTYTFAPTVGSDDLKTASLEMFDNVQNYAANYCVGQKLELGWQAASPMTMSMDFLGQKLVKQAKTGSLSDRTTEDVNGGLAKLSIDTTTIGTTAYPYPYSWKITLDNGWQQLPVMDGNLFPKDAVRSKARGVTMEAQLYFDTTAEYDNYTTPIERKYRMLINGTDAGGGNLKKLQFDWYGFYEDVQFGSVNGVKAATYKGRSQYDSGPAGDWGAAIINSLVTLP